MRTTRPVLLSVLGAVSIWFGSLYAIATQDPGGSTGVVVFLWGMGFVLTCWGIGIVVKRPIPRGLTVFMAGVVLLSVVSIVWCFKPIIDNSPTGRIPHGSK